MRKASYIVLWFLVLLSLALNGILLAGLWKARQAALVVIDQSIKTLERLEDETFATTVHVQKTVPVSADIPFHRELKVPVDVTVPLSHDVSFQESIELSFDTLLGTQTLDVPVGATIPLSLSVPVDVKVPVTISETIPVRTEVEIDVEVPVAVRVADTPLPGYLAQVKRSLTGIRKQLSLGGD